MYERLEHDREELRKSTEELEGMYAEVRAELGDNESIIKTYQKFHDELGRKYEDALLKIDKMNAIPIFLALFLIDCTMRFLTGTK